MNLRKVIVDDAALIQRQQERKKYRDDTWVTNARPLTESVFRDAVTYLKQTNHIFEAWVEKAAPSESQESVKLCLGAHKLPIKHGETFGVLESGASLSVNKQPDGSILVILRPYSSDVRYHRQKEFMLSGPIEPMALTERKLMGYLRDLLLLANVTSIKAGAGSLVSSKFFRMRLLMLKDFRNSQDLIRASSKAALIQFRGMTIAAVFGSLLTSLAWLVGVDWF